MEISALEFALQTWGAAELGDRRLTVRAVRIGRNMAAHPDASLANQMQDPAALEGAYRLMNNGNVSLQALLAPTYELTRQLASGVPLVVLWLALWKTCTAGACEISSTPSSTTPRRAAEIDVPPPLPSVQVCLT